MGVWMMRRILDLAVSIAVITASGVLVWSLLVRPAVREPVAVGAVRPAVGDIPFEGAPVRGLASATVGLVVFSDFECSFCRRLDQETLPAIFRNYVETGKALLGFRHLPLSIHPRARAAAEAAECAYRQQLFWPVAQVLFKEPVGPAGQDLRRLAELADLNEAQFLACTSGEASEAITRDEGLARELRVTGTPTTILGLVIGGRILEARRAVRGAQPFDVFEEELLKLIDLGGR